MNQRAHHLGPSLPRGFSLVELMLALVIMAILAVTAVPLYSRYVERSRLAEAKTNLTALAMLLEQHNAIYGFYCPAAECGADNQDHTYTYAENDDGSVQSDTITSWLRFTPKQATDGKAVRYTYTVRANSNSSYLVTATPVEGRGAPMGSNGGALTLDQDGAKTHDNQSGW